MKPVAVEDARGASADRPAAAWSGGRFYVSELTIAVSVALAIIIFGALNPRFFDVETAVTILENAAPDGLIVIGMTIVIICGAFDMSVGSALALCGLVGALVMNQAGLPVPVAIAAMLATGAVVGWVNGAIVARLKINPFITTLGTMSIMRGIVQVVTRSSPLTGFPAGFLKVAWGVVFTLHLPGGREIAVRWPVILLLVAIIVADVLLRRLSYLRQVYFIGSNEEAARLTGIPTARVKTFAFLLTGVLAALAGAITTSRANALDANAGMGAEMRVIAAVIVGGASLSGGRGTILGSFLGLMLMQVITTGLVFINVAAEAQLIAVGLVLILAAIIDRGGSSSVARKLASLLFQTRNKTMERIFNVILAVALAAVLVFHFTRPPAVSASLSQDAAPAAGAASNQRYVMISFVTGAPYWIDSKSGLNDKAKELGVTASFVGPATVDVNQQIDEIRRAMAEKVDGIILVPGSEAVAPAINEAIAAGIPVVCADNDAPTSQRYAFFGTGNYNAGYQGGQELARLLHGQGEVALMAIPGMDNLTRRIKGYTDALAQFPGIKIVQVGNDHGSQIEAEKECRALIQAYPNLAGFGCVAAAGGQGAAVAVKQAGQVGRIKIVAMDRDEATLQFIQEGVIDASIAQRTYTMPYLALQLLYDLHNNRIHFIDNWRKAGVHPLPSNVDTGSFVINRENVKFFFHKQ